MGKVSAVVILPGLVLALACCRTTPATVLVHVRAEAGMPFPDELRLSVLGAGGFELQDRRLPEQGQPQLPGDVVLYPKAAGSPLRLWVRGTAKGVRVGEGTASVTPLDGKQVDATVLLRAAALPDADGDGVPDAIDSCPALPNPKQGVCPVVDGGADARPDGPAEGGPADLHRDLSGDRAPVTCLGDLDCDDKNPCTSDRCDGGSCQHTAEKEGQSCDDGNPCTQTTRCTAGLCGGGAPVTCPASGNPCKPLVCDPASGCVPKALPDGSGCSDGLFCSDGDTCKAGACVAGKPRDCSATAPVCRTGSCNETSDQCTYSLVKQGTSCDDKDSCTQGESCDASGSCAAPAPLVEVAASEPMTWGTDRSTRVDSKGRVHTVFRQGGSSSPGKLFYATNASGSFVSETVDAAGDTGHWPSLALDAQDGVYVAYLSGAKNQVTLATRGATGWSTSAIDSGSGFTSIAVDGIGKLHVSYTKNYQLWYATGTAGSFAPTKVDEGSATTGVGYHSSLALDAQGRVHIAHGEQGRTNWYAQPIALRYSTNASGSWVTTQPAATTGPHGQFASLALRGADLYISHSSTSGYGSGVLYLTSRIGGTWKTEAVTSGANSGGFSSIVLSSQGTIYIAYRHPALSELHLATSGSSAWQTQKLEGGTDTTFGWPSLAQAKSGTLHITYKPGESPAEIKHVAVSGCP